VAVETDVTSLRLRPFIVPPKAYCKRGLSGFREVCDPSHNAEAPTSHVELDQARPLTVREVIQWQTDELTR